MINDFLHIELIGKSFNKVRETLSRIGISSHKDGTKKLIQSCHILKTGNGKYYIAHFKELFYLDGQEYKMSADDIRRRNKIAIALESWGMIKILTDIPRSDAFIKFTVVPAKEKDLWVFVRKYTMRPKQL